MGKAKTVANSLFPF